MAGSMGRLVFMILANIACMTHQHLVKGQGFNTCTYSSNCTATTNLGIIDLNGASKGSPYQCTNPATSNQYFWEPCTDFTLSGLTAGAMQQVAGAYTTSIGVHSLASCDTTTDGDERFNMKTDNYWFTWVKCICGAGDTLTFESENPVGNINLVFTSNACCAKSGTTSSLTGTTSFLTRTTSSLTGTTSSLTGITSSLTGTTSSLTGTTSSLKPSSSPTASPASRTDTPAFNEGTTLVIIFASILVVLFVCGTLFVVIFSKLLRRRRRAYDAL